MWRSAKCQLTLDNIHMGFFLSGEMFRGAQTFTYLPKLIRQLRVEINLLSVLAVFVRLLSPCVGR